MAAVEVGLGLSRAADLAESTREAARRAREGLRGGPPAAALVVSTGEPFPAAGSVVREVLGPVPITGGACAALLSDDGMISHGAAVLCFRSEEWVIQSACAGPTASAPLPAVDRVARLLLSGRPNRRRYPRGLALAFGDGRIAEKASTLSTRWREVMGPKLRTVGSLVFNSRGLYCGAVREPGPLSVLCLEGSGHLGIGVGLGWSPLSVTCTPTRTEGTLVHELDGRAAAEVYAEVLPASTQDPARFPLGILLPEDQWLIRGVLGIEGSALRLGGELPAGHELRLMAASPNGLQEAARDAAVTALKRLEGQMPSALMVVEDAARWAVQGEGIRREWEAAREQVPPETPCLGWLTASELVPGGSGQFTLQHGSIIVVALS